MKEFQEITANCGLMDDYQPNYGNVSENPPENRHETISELIHRHSKYCSSEQGRRLYTSM
jgi:hypothetical protein